LLIIIIFLFFLSEKVRWGHKMA